MKRLLPLATIEFFVWAILLLSTFLISKAAFSINLGNATAIQRIATQAARNISAGAIIIVWLLVWKKLTDFYLWRTLTRKRTTA